MSEFLIVDQSAVCGGAGNDKLGSVDESIFVKLVVVDDACLLVQEVGEHLEVFRDGRNFLTHAHEPVTQVASMGQIQGHDTVMRLQESRVDCKVSGRAGKGLDIDTPLITVQIKSL